MVLGTPEPDRIHERPGVHRRGRADVHVCFGYHSGAPGPWLTCTLRGKSPTRAAIVGSDARIEGRGATFYAPAAVTLVPGKRRPDPASSPVHEGRGLRHQADEGRGRPAGPPVDLESPLMPLDETISIMEDDGHGCWCRPRQNA